jgi:hypothetical protein
VVVFNVADSSIITNTVAPQALQLMSQTLTEKARIVIGSNALEEVLQNTPLYLPVQ